MTSLGSGRAATGSLALPALKRRSLRHEATDLLRARVTAGELEPGRLYTIGDIASQLGVSPTPVREAVLELANQGLIEMVRNRGFRVMEVNGEDLEEIADIRQMLEAPAMARLADRSSELDFDALRSLSADIERAASEGDLVTFLTLDKDFHLGLLGTLGNSRLVQVVTQLRDQTRLSGLRPIAGTTDLVRSAHEHDQLLDALAASDGDAAEGIMRNHLGHVVGLWSGRPEKQ